MKKKSRKIHFIVNKPKNFIDSLGFSLQDSSSEIAKKIHQSVNKTNSTLRNRGKVSLKTNQIKTTKDSLNIEPIRFTIQTLFVFLTHIFRGDEELTTGEEKLRLQQFITSFEVEDKEIGKPSEYIRLFNEFNKKVIKRKGLNSLQLVLTEDYKIVMKVNQGTSKKSIKTKDINWQLYDKIGRAIFIVVYFTLSILPILLAQKKPTKNAIIDKANKIIIYPFGENCTYGKVPMDVGQALEMGINNLKVLDSLDINVEFLANHRPAQTSSREYYDSVRIKEKANVIVYGFTRNSECSASGSDEICINYLSNLTEQLKIGVTQDDVLVDFQPFNTQMLDSGIYREKIDLLILWNTILTLGNSNTSKSIKYIDKMIAKCSVENKAVLIRLKLYFSLYSKRYSSCIKVSNQLLSIYPKSMHSEILPVKMISFMHLGNQDSARAVGLALVKNSKESFQIYNILSMLKLNKSDDKDEFYNDIQKLQKLASTQSEKFEVSQKLSQYYIITGQFNKAFILCDSLINKGKSNVIIYEIRAICYEAFGNFDFARNDFKESLELKPHQLFTKVRYAYSQFKTKEPFGDIVKTLNYVLKHIDEIKRKDRKDLTRFYCHYLLGLIYYNEHQPNDARIHLIKAMNVNISKLSSYALAIQLRKIDIDKSYQNAKALENAEIYSNNIGAIGRLIYVLARDRYQLKNSPKMYKDFQSDSLKYYTFYEDKKKTGMNDESFINLLPIFDPNYREKMSTYIKYNNRSPL